MLVDPPIPEMIHHNDPGLMDYVRRFKAAVENPQVGVYHIPSYNPDHYFGIRGFDHCYPEPDPEDPNETDRLKRFVAASRAGIWRSSYGVCDTVEQVLAYHDWAVKHPTRKFVLAFAEVRRDEQPEQGGWRWHKWGPYIGTHEIQCEYLYDEKGIDAVLIFHLLEVE